MNEDLGKSSTGLNANVAGLLCYSLGLITGVIFFLIEKENKFIRFHAVQSAVVFGALFVLQVVLPVIPFFGGILTPLVSLASVVLWVVMMIKAYQGEKFKLPIVGDIAEKKA
ncbi:MAG TPA: DUF4870 domain-containing protein [Candidatus Omnitrophota bacterium]|nr:hypothetical protein [Candidatus Omnitrophota bacterium]HRK60931.1 DUF4870 domain-containing protein [Candidatus Omnitrophota bacterium]